MEILHTSNILKSDISFIDTDLEDITTRNSHSKKTPTATLPYLSTEEGNISESISIQIFLAKKFNPDFLGTNIFQRSQINMWIEFANCELQNNLKKIIYPIFKGKINYDNEINEEKKLEKNLKILENEFNKGNKKYIIGNVLTLADVILFRYLRFFMMFYLTEKIRKLLYPKLTQWFMNIMNTPEAIDAYGRTILCKKQLKPLILKTQKKQEKNIVNELRKNLLENNNKKKELENLWNNINFKEYSFWLIEYQNLESEKYKLFRLKNSKNFFLERIDEKFKKFAFGVHGVYSSKYMGYKVRGVWMWKGMTIPEEIKNNEYFGFLDIKKLECDKNIENKKLVEDFWTKCNKGDEIDKRKLEDVSYF